MKQLLLILSLLLSITTYASKREIVQQELTDTERQCFLYYFYEAARCFEAAEYDRAMALYLFAEQINSEDAAVHNALGTLYHGLQNKEESLRHFAKAYNADPLAYWETYAGALYGHERYTDAERVLEYVHKQQPDNTDIAESLTNVYVQQKKYKKALRLQNRLVQVEGVNAYNTMARYRILLLQQKPEKAIDVVVDYLEASPDDYRMQTFLGDIYFSTGQMDKALIVFLAEQERHPDNPYNYLSLGKLYEEQGEKEKAAEATISAVLCEDLSIGEKMQTIRTHAVRIQQKEGLLEQTLRTLLDEYPLEEEIYWTLSALYLQQNQPVQAREMAQAMAALNPQNQQAWDMQLEGLQKDSAATDSMYAPVIRGAYEQFPAAPKWCYYMASVLLMEDKMDSAIVVSKAGLQPFNGREQIAYQQAIRVRLGDIYSSQKELDSAFYYYEEVLRIDPENIYTLNNYAYLLATNGGDLRKAEKMSQITIQKEPDNPIYLDTYAWILHLQGGSAESLAKFYIQRAMDNAGNLEDKDEIILHYNIINHIPRNEKTE